MDVATALNALNAKVRLLNARDVGEGNAVINLTLEVRDLTELRGVMNRISAVRGVSEVVRSNA